MPRILVAEDAEEIPSACYFCCNVYALNYANSVVETVWRKCNVCGKTSILNIFHCVSFWKLSFQNKMKKNYFSCSVISLRSGHVEFYVLVYDA